MFQSSKQPPYFSYELILHHSPVPSWGQTSRNLVLFSVGACRRAEPCLLWGSLHELTHKHEDESQMARLLLESQLIWVSLGCFPPWILHSLPHCRACCASALKGDTEKGLCLGKRKTFSSNTVNGVRRARFKWWSFQLDLGFYSASTIERQIVHRCRRQTITSEDTQWGLGCGYELEDVLRSFPVLSFQNRTP